MKRDDPIPSPRERTADVGAQLHEHLASLGIERDADLGSRRRRAQASLFDEPNYCEDEYYESHDVDDPHDDYDHWIDDYEDAPSPFARSWVELWVDGIVSDAQGRDAPEPWEPFDWDYDELAELDNPLLEHEEPASPTVDLGREAERRRAGERYYRAHRRTTLV